jgi:predicted O-methyltransferase YrrM
MTPHLIIIQAVYTDHNLSARRLAISQHTSKPSLAYQTRKPVIVLSQHPDDPHAQERLQMYSETGCEVQQVWRTEWKLYGEDYELPAGRKVVSRMDDDDVIAVDFCERTYAAGVKAENGTALIWPQGMTYWRHQAYSWRYPGNQFVSIVTDKQQSPHDIQHHKFLQWPHVVVSEQVGWIWIRHGSAHTPTLARYRPRRLNRIDTNRTPVNMRAISRAIEPSGKAAGTYAEHQRRKPAQSKPGSFSEALRIEGSDKTTVHTYGQFYDDLIADLQPRRVLEIGVFQGASIRAWRHLREPVEVVGIDRNPCPGIPVIRCTAPDFSPALEQLQGQQFDLIIDDGSHQVPHQIAAIQQLAPLLRSGGLFVVEDLQDDAATAAVLAAFPAGWRPMGHDFRQEKGRYDDVIVSAIKPVD